MSLNYPVKGTSFSKSALEICIIGNAQKREHALAMARMWDHQFRSFWYIWDESSKENLTLPSNVTFIYSNEILSWTKGIELVWNVVYKVNEPCDYIFTHDDDLEFRIKGRFSFPNMSLANRLLTILKDGGV